MGTNFITALDLDPQLAEDVRLRAIKGVEAVLGGRAATYALEHAVGPKWLATTVTPLGGGAEGAVVTRSDITELRCLQDELREQASTDELTGVFNRRRFNELAHGELLRAARFGQPLALALVDLDDFKQINDRYGHGAGDLALQALVRICRSNIREIDVLARLGGDEFVLLFLGTGPDQAREALERIRHSVNATSIDSGSDTFGFTISCGFSIAGADEALQALLGRADAALYRAKDRGRNCTEYIPPDMVASGVSPAPAEMRDAIIHLAWKSSYESGNAVIDEEHRELLRLANRLLALAAQNAPAVEFEASFKALLAHVAAHFAHEEAILRNLGYVDIEAHAEQHRVLLAQARALAERNDGSLPDLGELAGFFALEVVSLHMLKSDRQFYPLIDSVGVPEGTTLN